MRILWLAFCSLALLTSPCLAQDNLDLVYYGPINVDEKDSTASTVLQLRNPNPKPLKFTLVIGDFRSLNTDRKLRSRVKFHDFDGKPAGPVLGGEAPADESISVRVDFAHLTEAGLSQAELYCNGQQIHVLTAFREVRLPFKVSLVGNPSEKPKLSFVRGQPRDLYIENDSAMTYPIVWELTVKDRTVSGEAVIQASGVTRIRVQPDAIWFSDFRSLFRDESAQASLIVRYRPHETQIESNSISKRIPIEAQLSHAPPGQRDFWANVIILFVLALGGGTSVYINVDLANRLRKIKLQRRLDQLARTIGEIGGYLSSKLRVVLFLERKRITEMLPAGFLITPGKAAVLARCSTDTDLLAVRVELSEQISDSRSRQAKLLEKPDSVPSLMDRIDSDLEEVETIIGKSTLTPAEKKKAEALIGSATGILDDSGKPDNNLEKELEQRAQSVQAKFATGTTKSDPICTAIEQAAPIPFRYLVPAIVKLGSQADRDTNLRKLEVIYALIEMQCQPDAEMIEYLQRQDIGGLRSAELHLRQLREGIGRNEILQAITAQPPELSIHIDRNVVRVNQAVMMNVAFNNPRFAHAAAKQLIRCKWRFGHGKYSIEEEGWEVHHYRPQPCEYPVTVSFEDENKNPITSGGPVAREVKVFAAQPEKWSRGWVETQRWAAAFALAIIGLFAGAKDKILTLDTLGAIVAVFLLGFTVDMAKNLLVSKENAE